MVDGEKAKPRMLISTERLKFLLSVASDEPKSVLERLIANSTQPPAFSSTESDVPESAANIEVAATIAEISCNHVEITKAAMNDAETKSLRDFAVNYNKKRLLQVASRGSALVTGIRAEDDSPPTQNLVDKIINTLFQRETSGVIVRMLKDGQLELDRSSKSQTSPMSDAAPSGSKSKTANNSLRVANQSSLNEDIIGVLQNNQHFNFRYSSLVSLLKDPKALADTPKDRQPVIEKTLKQLHTAQALASTPDALPALFNFRLTAYRVSQVPRDNFVSQFKDLVGGQATASQIHDHAVQVVSRNEQALTSVLQAARGSGIAAIDGKETRVQRLERMKISASEIPEQINLEKLFGSLDFCECDDCTSVLSPAAYYVELLQYLRNNNLHPDDYHSDISGFRGTPLEKLFRRRPDLACLELTCANTNTVLPYIDLANEVMESFIVHIDKYSSSRPKQSYIDIWNASSTEEGLGGSSAELLAAPQNVNYDAYCILHQTVYPATKLPYHQPIDSIRQFLKFLETSRAEVIEVFRGPYVPPLTTTEDTWESEHCYSGCVPLKPKPSTCCGSSDPVSESEEYLTDSSDHDEEDCDETPVAKAPSYVGSPISQADRNALIKYHDEAIARATDAELLLLTEEEYIILTKEAFWQKGHFSIRHGEETPLREYQERIGVRKAWEYWGRDYTSLADMLDTDEDSQKGLTFVKAQFLPRSGIRYEELVDLVKTEFINPRMPKGRDKVIMESLQFSYRYLATLVETKEKRKSARLCRLIEFIERLAWKDPTLAHLLAAEKCKKACCQALYEYLTKPIERSTRSENNPQPLNSGEKSKEKHGRKQCPVCCQPKHGRCQCELKEELRRWILTHFEDVGKMIILDNGEGPRLPWEADIIKHTVPDRPPSIRGRFSAMSDGQSVSGLVEDDDVVLGHLYPDGKILKPAPSTELLATVSLSGLVTLPGGRLFMEDYQDTNIEIRLKRTDDPTNKDSDGIIQKDSYIKINGMGVGNAAWTPVTDDCNLVKTRLVHLNGGPLSKTEYDRMHRFLRIWRALGWTIPEVDAALRAFGIRAPTIPDDPPPAEQPPVDDDVDFDDYEESCDTGTCAKRTCQKCSNGTGSRAKLSIRPSSKSPKHHACTRCKRTKPGNCTCEPQPTQSRRIQEITPYFLHQAAILNNLVNLTGLSLMELLAFFGPIDTYGEKPLYARLFLTHNMLGIDTIFQPDEDGNYLAQAENERPKLRDHIPVLLASLHLKVEDLNSILQVAQLTMDDFITIGTISSIYRHSMLAKILAIKPLDLPAWLAVFSPPWASAQKLFDLLSLWNMLTDSGFSVKQLAWLLNDHDDPVRPIAPAPRVWLQAAASIYDNFQQIEAQNPTVNTVDQASPELLLSKLQLLYTSEVAGQIASFLQGTMRYTTNAPKQLVLIIPDDLKGKLSYKDGDTAFVEAIGQLTSEEIIRAKSLSSNIKWLESIDRLGKKALAFFKANFTGIFTSEDEAKTKLLTGDTPADAEHPDTSPGTGPLKILYFLQNFVPFLRKNIEDKAVVDAMSSASSLPPDVVEYLIEDALVFDADPASGNPGISARQLLDQIHNEPTGNTSAWAGYLIPPTTKKYTLAAPSVVDDSRPGNITIDDIPYTFKNQQEDPTNVWFGDEIKLIGGQLYKITVPDQSAFGLLWGVPPAPLSSIPKSNFLPGHAEDATKRVVMSLAKASIVIGSLTLSKDEVVYFQNHGANFDNFDLNHLALAPLRRMLDYTKLKSSLPKMTKTLLDLFSWANLLNSRKEEVPDQIASVTDWDLQTVKSLTSPSHFNLELPSAYKDEKNLLKLQRAIEVVNRTRTDPSSLFSWAKPRTNFKQSHDISESIRKNVRARYLLSEWEVAVKSLYDTLRQNQSNALVAYLVVEPLLVSQGVIDADSLFEFFLIDVSMCPCMETSRLKQATSSVQLFIQRCFLGLEDQGRGFGQGVSVNALDRGRWSWMQRYRVWEANRKVFLYPENWIQSSLRDDKSPQFKAIESEMLQKDISEANVLTALKNYLFALDEIANLKATGLFVEDVRDSNSNTKPRVNKVHFFAVTQSTPSKHFYRVFEFRLKEWTPWEQMEIDVPNYEIERSEKASSKNLNGNYVVPFMYNNRLLVGLPQFMRKQKPKKELPGDKTFNQLASGEGDFKAKDAVPDEYWEIRMGFTELLNGKWRQKIISTEAILSDAVQPKDLPEVGNYQFVPIIPTTSGAGGTGGSQTEEPVTSLSIIVLVNGSKEVGRFIFTGSLIIRGTTSTFSPSSSVNGVFQLQSGNMKSLQVAEANGNSLSYPSYPAVKHTSGSTLTSVVDLDSAHDTVFYHQFQHALINRASRMDNLDDLFAYFSVITTKDNAFGGRIFDPEPDDAEFRTYNELYRPYSLYNWEVGFHAPMALVDRLLQTNQFDLALKFCHYVFDPYAKGSEDKRWWLWPPFKEIDSIDSMEKLFSELRPNESVPVDHQINRWRDNPFQPHVLARLRPVAYMKWVVMKYIQILLAYGDYYFKQNTLEMIPMAIQCYVLASHVYGPRGQKIPKRGKKKAQTYFSLVNQWDAFGNAMVELELQFPFSNQTEFPWGESNGVVGLANIFGFATSSYFCIPDNAQLTQLRDQIDDRLFKIRHCQDINGIERRLPLYEPAIDPGLLVAAAAAGLSLESVLADLNTPMPNYRFPYLLQKALELCAELKGLSAAFLTALEKKDGEALTILRQQHDTSIQALVMEQKKLALEEAAKNLEALVQSRERPKNQLKHMLKLLGQDESLIPDEDTDWKELNPGIEQPVESSGYKMTPGENEESNKGTAAFEMNRGSSTITAISGSLHILPTTNLHGSFAGVGPAVCWGPPNLAEGMNATASVIRIAADSFSHESGNAARRNNLLRSSQDRTLSANSSGYELKNIDRQIITQRIKIDLCNADITTQQKQIDNLQEVTDFLKNKYTNQELYIFMEQTLRTLCYQTYQMAYDWAKKAERAFRFERGVPTGTATPSYIEFGYWQPSRDGLMAGEQLALSLKRLEAAYIERQGYDFEVTKHVSLRLISPLALINLRETGKCEFAVPEILFDMDFPGHYRRKIKSVAVTVPCVAGPYTSINGTLRLLAHKYRTSSVARDKRDYVQKTAEQEEDPRFETVNIPVDAIAVSSGQNDAGIFELNFRDERYLPFEGAGAISLWRFELPSGFRQFDYGTITDVVMHLRYTSVNGGSKLRTAAEGAVDDFVRTMASVSETDGLFSIVDVRAEYAMEWYKFRQPLAPGATERKMEMKNVNERLPVYTKGRKPDKIIAATVWILVDAMSLSGDDIMLSDGKNELVFEDSPSLSTPTLKVFAASGPCALSSWSLQLRDLTAEMGQMLIVSRYSIGD